MYLGLLEYKYITIRVARSIKINIIIKSNKANIKHLISSN